MSGDTVDQLYNAVHADGAVTGTREDFRKFFLAPGKQGYQNRLKFYNALHADGAVTSGTYEEFAQRLGLHARPRSKAVQQAVAYKPQVPNNFGGLDTQTAGMSWLQRQNMTQKQKAASEKRKAASRAAVKGNIVGAGETVTGQKAVAPVYREKKEGKYWNPVTETEMGNDTVLDWSTTDANGDKVANVDKKQNFEADAAAKALIRSFSHSKHDNAFEGFDKDFGKLLNEKKDDWHVKWDAISDAPTIGDIDEKVRPFGMEETAFQKVYNEYGPKVSTEEDYKAFLENNSSEIANMARQLHMTPESLVSRYIAPNFGSIDEEEYRKSAKKFFTPKNFSDRIIQGLLTSGEANMLHITPDDYQDLRNEAIADYQEENSRELDDKGVFSKEGIAALGRNLTVGGAQIAPSGVGFAFGGAEAKGTIKGLEMGWNALRRTGLATKILGKAVPKTVAALTKKYGAATAGKILSTVNNENLGSFMLASARQFGQGSLTMGYFEANNYLATEGREKIKEGKWGELAEGLYTHGMSGLGTGMLFSGIGTATGALGRNLGITGAEASRLEKVKHGTQKALFSASALFAEGLGFRAEDLYDEAKKGELTFGSVLENGGKGVIDKITMDLGMAAGKGKLPNLKQMIAGKVMNTNPHVTFSAAEKNELLRSTGGKSLLEALDGIGEGNVPPMYRKKFGEFFNDPNVSRRTKQKVAYVVGKAIDTNIPRTERVSITQGAGGTQEVRTYSKDGELLTIDVYENKEKAEMAKEKVYVKRDRDDAAVLVNDSLKPTQDEMDKIAENTAGAMGFDNVGEYLAALHDAGETNDADFLSKHAKVWQEEMGKVLSWRHQALLDTMRDVNDEYSVDIDKLLTQKDPSLWKEDERDAVLEFCSRLKKGFSDKNDEAQNNAVARQDGADLSEQTELEDSERFTENAKTVNDRQASATEAWMEMVKNNPDLEEWMKSNPNASVEELRENFGDDVADAYMELSNAQAMRDGFMQNTGSKIEDAVRNQVEQAKFTGTMQGMGSEDRIFVFIDSTGNEYTLVGGDVVFDQTDSRFKTGESGLVILRDKDGNIVQDKRLEDLYFTNYYSYEEYADVIRKRLQEQKTAEIQSTETPLPEAPKEEAPAEGPKEEPEDSKTAYEKEKSSDSNKTTDTATVSLKGDTALSQSEESSSNDKDTTKSSDLQAGNETLTFKDGTEAPANYDLNDIPMDDNGEPIYESVPKERTVQDLFGKLDDGNLAREYSEMRVSEAEKELKEAKKKEPKMGTKINEYLSKKKEYEERVKAAEGKVAYWESVKEDIEKLTHTTPEELKEAKEELDGTAAREEFKKTFDETQPADGVALAAKFVADAKVTPESFKKETGMGAAEQKSFVGMIAKEEKGGKSIERLGEDLVQLDNDEYGGVYFHGDSNDARSAIISALTGAKTRKGLREMAEPDMERTVSERAQMSDEAYNERYGMDHEEYLLYSEQEMPHILGNLNNFDEQKYLQDKAVDIINQLDKEYGKVTGENDSRGEESVHVEGDKVLSEERPNDGGGGESPEKHGGREKDERRSDTTDAPLHETPSRREGGVKSADPSDVAEGMREAAEQFHQERVEKARKAYEDAKAIGDTSETKRTKDEYRKALDDKLKAQGIGLVERRKTIAKEMGEEPKVEEPKGEAPKDGKKHWDSLTPTEKVEKADADPLTEEEIRSDEENKELAAAAIAYLNGDKSLLNQIAYLKIYGNVRNRHEDVPGNSGTEDKTQLATSDTGSGEGLGLEPGRSGGGSAEPLDSGTGGEAAPGKRESGTNSEGGPDTAAGEGGDIKGEGNTPGLDGVPAGSGGRERGGTAGSKGNLGSGRGRGSGNGPSKPDGKRKPAAKQGTTFPNSKGTDVKKETSDAKAAMKAAFAEFKKRGKNGSASISLVGMNNEQIEYLPELMKATGRYGIAVMREGIYKAKEWFDNIREAISDDMKDIGFKDADVDEYIREMWHMPWEMDGETHKIGEWASIKGYANLRESLKEPLRKKFDKQVLAEATEVKVGDRKNIEETLPFLLPQQQDDVLKAETQFFDESHKDKAHAGGKGYMFTNGTGTGKTYTGLGIIKRMTKQGKGRILIITPSQQKVKDWINDGKNLCLDIRDLDDWSKEHGSTATNEKGKGVVITTFANFGTNKTLLEDQFDAVIYDESHRIMENKGANETARSRQHYMLTNRNESYALMRLEEINPDCMKMRGLAEDFEDARKKETARIKGEYEKNNPSADAADVRIYMAKNTPKDIQSFSMADKAKFPELGKIYEDYRKARDYYINNVKPELEKQAKESVDKTKVVFLSATPFNTRENIEYAEGYLFSYPERNESGQSGKAQFFLDHFGAGYKFRYNRLERSTANAEALAKQEVAFSDWLQNDLGTMSGRIIDSPYDYSRDFPTVSVEHARDFNEACEEISRDDVFGAAYREVLGDYNYGSALFETMKVAAMLPRLREHIAAGRKVVVFHRRVSSKEPLQAPFGMILGENAEKAIKKLPKDKQPEARARLNELRSKYSELLKWEQTLDFSMPREQLAKAFGEDNVLYFSGQESSKVKNEAVKQFNDDNSGKNIIVIQEASGKEGISLHDTTGKHQRVSISLALPQSPITALQIEGRTYRIGNESNAIFEYPVLGLVSEYNLFASKFNQQVSTTENLALGSQARNLRESFARGIEEHSGYVPLDQQGVGGKDFDKADESDSDSYDNAILDYYTNQKLNRNNREGVDYFPTPEPLGYKVVEWANIGEGDSVLEPSAGHGAIARYAPQSNELVAIEPSMSLFAKLQIKAGGLGRKFQNDTFENYYIGNKHDTIVMNPPFGKAGATAIAHVEKAFGHLEEGGRVVAIIPRGAMDKKFDKWYEGEKSAVLRAEIDLPDIVFEQAGTKVRCRVVVVDKITDASLRARAEMTQVDLSRHYDKIEDFFEDLRDVEVPERIIDQQAKQMKKSKATVSELKNMRGVYDVSLDRDGIEVGARGVRARIEFKENESADAFKKRMAGLYDQFAQNEKRCANYNMDASAVYGELKDLTCKLADMTEDEMRRYLTSNNGVRFRDEDSKLNSEDSEKLFASLQNKKGKEYYDTVTELANRVKQGRARTMRLGEEVERKGMESFPLSVFRLLATSNKNLSGAFRSSIETRPDTMEEREPSAETIHSVNLATQKGIIDWAKENGYKFDEPDIKKDSFDGKAWNEDGWESTIYRSKDGKSVIKYTPLSTLYNNPTLRYLDRTMCFNHIFPDTAIDVIGFGYDNDGQFSMVTKQPLIEGKTLDKYFNGDDAKIREYTDNFLKELGYTQKTLNEEGYEADSNGKFVLFDLNKGNIIIDKEGKPHVIDCEVLPVGYDKINSFEIKDDAAQGDTRFRNEGEMTPEERREESRLEEHRSTVEKAAKKLNTDVTICESIDDVTNAEARAAIERGERVKAWYDTRTGEVHLYLPNVTDKYDAQKSIAHEVIGHKGMRGLLGEDGYRTMLRRMYTHLSDTEAREVNERMMRNGWDFYTAMDEWVADKAEESVWQLQENPKYIGLSNLWSHIKKSVTEAMHKAGYYINPNVDDVKYWLWESKRALRDGNAETEMRRNAFLWKLGHEEMNDDVVMGEYTGEGEAEREMEISTLFRSTSIDENKHDTLEKRSQKQQIDDILKSSAYRHTEAFGDSDISLKTTIEVMSKGLPDGMNDSMNFYDGNNQLSSVVFDRMEKFMYTTGKQLNDVIRKCRRVLGGKDRDFDRLNLYAIVKHGLERNRWLYVRKAAEALDKKIREMNAAISKDGGVAIVSVYGDALKTEFLDFAKRKREELYSGGISYGDYLHALDGFIKDYAIDMESIPENERGAVSKLEKWFGEHFSDVYTAGGNDYSGLRGIEELRTEDGIDDAAAIDRVSSMENELGEELTRELWTNTKSVTFAGLEWQYKHGLISKKQFEQTQELFAYYVPLRGFSKETMEDQYAYMRGGSGEGKGSLIMKAEGRKSLSVSPFSTALYQTNIAIERASRNQNNQRAWRFALAWTKNNTEIGEDGKVKMKEEAPILISDVWYKKDEDGVWEVSAPEITEGMSADEVRSAVEAHESEMRSLQAEGKAKKRLTDKDRVPFGSAFEESSHRNEHVVDVWMNGERKRLVFMNPKAAQALNGELNKGQTDSIYRYLRKGLRTMSSLMTTYNATFAGRNFIRDYQFANDNVFIKEGRAYWLQMCKNQMRLLGERVDKDGNVSLMHVLGKHNLWFKLWRDYRNDVAPRTEVERYFKEFMENGGRTGFNEALKVDKLEDNLRKASEAGNAKNFALHMLGGMGEVMDYLNERAENFNRFATYMTSRQTGRSVMRSIADAKNVTVNFNRRGAGSKAFGNRASRKDKVLGFVYDYVGSNHVFVNAAIQGYRIFAGNLRHHPVKTLGTMILTPMIMGQVVVPMLNAWLAGSLFDEEGDPYSTLSDWDRRNNICLYSGKGKWVKIPLAIEHRAFYGMGDLINAYTGKLLHKSGGTENGKTNWLGSIANESLVTPTKFGLRYGAAYDFTWGMIRQMLEIAPYNPVGSNGNVVSNVVFGDYISPVVEAARNEDWAGKPIYKDTPWNKDDPEWQRVFKGENAGLVYLSKKLNDWSLGDDYTPGLVDINPALVSHFITSYLGGAATDIIKLTDLAANFTEGAKEGWQKKDGNKVVNTLKGGVKNTRTDDVAIVRAFYSMPTEKTKYYRALNKYATYKKYLEAYGERMDKKLKSDNVEFVKEANAEIYHNGVDMQRFHILDAYEKAIRNAIKYRNGKDVSEADKAIVDEDINMMKMEAVKEMESIFEAKPIKKKR